MRTMNLVPSVVPSDGTFDTIAGLPVHPLVVHVAVVILPLAALALIVLVFVPRWRGAFGWLTVAGLFVGAGAAFVAKESGEALAERVGLPTEHADLGDVLPLVAGVLFLVGLAWFLVDRRARAAGTSSIGATILAIVSVIMAVGTVALTVAVGHSGAVAVWGATVASGETTDSGSGTTTDNGSGTAGSFTLADVQAHSTPADCWATINGTVYDFTDWINRHPGGARDIEALCGTDATQGFANQHGNQREPNAELQQFAIGTLSAAGSGAAATVTPAAVTVQPAKVYRRAEVRLHNTASDCWTVIDRKVYDLTSWVNRHPGGASRIIAICGRDGTAAFASEHSSTGGAARDLATFQIGRLPRLTAA